MCIFCIKNGDQVDAEVVAEVMAEELKMKKEIHRVRVLTEKFNLAKTAGIKATPVMILEFKDITGMDFPG